MAPSPTLAIDTKPLNSSANGVKKAPRSVWDPATQEEHGGQTWSQLGDKFVCDFSVTTNALGSPESGIDAAREALADIHHYPAADAYEARMALARFCSFDADRTLLCNGASEMIELLMRVAPSGGFRPSPYDAAYMEYVRAARVAGRKTVDDVSDAAVSIVIRPNSPTGHFMPLDDLREYIKQAGGMVVIDESFICFNGKNWRDVSALNLIDEFPDGRVAVLFSWTKLWSCPGLRLGSVAAGAGLIRQIKSMQTPWSCNSLAQAFLKAACSDTKYMQRTWDTLPVWKRELTKRIERLGWKVNIESPDWVPWVFFECPSDEVAARAADVAFQAGCPVRLCRSFGIPKCIRLGVRAVEHQEVLQTVWEKEFL